MLGESWSLNFDQYAFLWTEAEGMRNIGGLGTVLGLSDRNEVVGWNNRVRSPFSWTPERGVVYLKDHLEPFSRHWNLRTARAVNSRGWIAGEASLLSNPSETRPVLLIPME